MIDLVSIPAGSFIIGSPPEEAGRYCTELQLHKVTLESFFLGKYPITQAQWVAVMGDNPSEFKGKNRPVESVSWHDAMVFCWRLSQRTGHHYTLPSEAQWEYACRAGTTTPFSFGETISPEQANYDSRFAYAGGPTGEYRPETSPVGSFPANAWGLHDMHGNVWEWCLDTEWHDNYEVSARDGRAWNVQNRILRGGSWFDAPHFCRSAYRGYYYSAGANGRIGFRVCCLLQD